MANKKAIILLHGLFLHPIYMLKMKKYFLALNYDVYSYGYKSTRYNSKVLDELLALVKKINNPHTYFIGHSMGGIILRNFFQDYHTQLNLEDTAIITLGTPHYTSDLGTFLESSSIGKIMGTAGKSGITKKYQLKEWTIDAPIGCIAGISNWGPNLILSHMHHRKDLSDGTVFLNEAILENCTDRAVLKCQHTALIYSTEVMHLCYNFIVNKKF